MNNFVRRVTFVDFGEKQKISDKIRDQRHLTGK